MKDTHSCEEIFSQIYLEGRWGKDAQGEGTSGKGSHISNAKVYVVFLQDFLQKRGIKSVIDVGCGDWGLSQYIDWQGISYIGTDVVVHIIEKNKKQFATPSIQFICGDALREDLPAADLFICKDMMQHLTHQQILKLCEQLPKYTYCLLTNDVDPLNLSSFNDDLPEAGGERTLDLTWPPFSLEGEKMLTWSAHDNNMKQVLFIRNDIPK